MTDIEVIKEALENSRDFAGSMMMVRGYGQEIHDSCTNALAALERMNPHLHITTPGGARIIAV